MLSLKGFKRKDKKGQMDRDPQTGVAASFSSLKIAGKEDEAVKGEEAPVLYYLCCKCKCFVFFSTGCSQAR